MNKSKGNMYKDVTHTWNPIRGKCPHDCVYCYMKSFNVGELRLDEKALNEDLGEGNTIFVGSSTDMWTNEVQNEWIDKVLNQCKIYWKNKYLFQTKNPERFLKFSNDFTSMDCILGTTIETNREYNISKAPSTEKRAKYMWTLFKPTMISIEPIVDFDLNIFVEWIEAIGPDYVSIGADSKGHNLPEPSKEKIEALIIELKKFTEVKIKDNLRRLTNAT